MPKEPKTTPLHKRLLELIGNHRGPDGKVTGWQSIVDTLNSEKLFNAKGGEWNRLTIMNVYQQLKKSGHTHDTTSGHTEAKPAHSAESDQLHTKVIPKQEATNSGHTEDTTTGHTQVDITSMMPGMTKEPQALAPVTEPPQEASYQSHTEQNTTGHTESHTEQHIDQTPVIPPTESGHTEEAPMSHTEIADLVTATVQQELSRLLKGVEPMELQKSGRGGGKHTEKRTFSIPADTWEELRALGGVASNHVSLALRLYLNLKKGKGIKE